MRNSTPKKIVVPVMKSNRKDGRGHWPRGKRRSRITTHKLLHILKIVERAVEQGLSRRELARLARVDEHTVRRWISREDWPSERSVKMILRRLA